MINMTGEYQENSTTVNITLFGTIVSEGRIVGSHTATNGDSGGFTLNK